MVVLTLLQISIYPALKKTFGKYAFPVSFTASLLLFTLISWYCGLFRIPVQIAILPFLALFGYHLYQHRYPREEVKKEWLWELLFLLCFFLMLEVRFVNPTISYAEKFMDHAFLASVMRNPIIPPLDPWFAGGYLNVYYYLGYWMFGCLGIVTLVPSNIAFNLALPTIFALVALNLYAIGHLILERFRWLPLVILFIPNPSFFYQYAQGKAMNAVMWDSTRTITNTINEYPLFSFIWGDVHPHVISMFNQIFLLFLLLFAYKKWESLELKSKWLVCIFAAISLGSMPLFNTWDVLIYAPITVLFGMLIGWRGRKTDNWKSPAWFLFTVPPIALLCYLPFYLQLQTHTGGVSIVQAPSDPIQFLLVNGVFIAIFCIILSKDIAQRPYLLLAILPFFLAGYVAASIAVIPFIYLIAKKQHEFPDILAVIGLLILIFCEIFYLRDNMGDLYFRMNTVFKCYLPAWLILGIASFSMLGEWLADSGGIPVVSNRKKTIIAVVVTGMLFMIPFIIPINLNYGTHTLDGLAYLQESHWDDAGAVSYLRGLTGNERIVEAEGGDYTYYSRISSFTGIPAIIGMPFHEYMWRSDDTGWYSTRRVDIKTIYEQPDQTIPLMKKYNATLLYVGDAERERYRVNLTFDGLERIYCHGGTEIYRLSG